MVGWTDGWEGVGGGGSVTLAPIHCKIEDAEKTAEQNMVPESGEGGEGERVRAHAHTHTYTPQW